MTEIIKYDLEFPVRCRKYDINNRKLALYLRGFKSSKNLTITAIANKLNVKKTEVDHWFRLDNCFSVPNEDIWFELKKVLGIDSDLYDKEVLTFEEKPGVFEKAGRFYDVNGLAPTLTVASADEKIIIREEEEYIMNNIKPKQSGEIKPFTYASAFAGIGGMTIGLKPLGGIGVAAWEYDPTEKRTQYAQDAHKLLHPEIPLYGDICEAVPEELPDFDVFCFTPPCQAFSVAGKRGGFEDTRGTLTFEVLRIAKEKQPKILFMENVKGLVNHDKGNTMSVILHAINEIGYSVDFTILNSKYFDVAQNRERVYLVAVRNDLVKPEPWIKLKGNTLLPKAKAKYQAEGVRTFNFDFPEEVEVRTRLRDFLSESVDEKYYISEEKTAKLVAQLSDQREVVIDVSQIGHEGKARLYYDISPTITAREYKEPRMLGSLNHYGNDQMNRVYDPNGISPTITVVSGGGREQKIAVSEEFSNYRIRKITPEECLRLQSIPPNVTETLMNNFSDSRIYKFAGNGLTINVISAIGEKLIKYL